VLTVDGDSCVNIKAAADLTRLSDLAERFGIVDICARIAS